MDGLRDRPEHVLAGIDGRAVARNIFLDGNTFRDSRSLGYTHVLSTREFESQDGARHDFGAFSLSMEF